MIRQVCEKVFLKIFKALIDLYSYLFKSSFDYQIILQEGKWKHIYMFKDSKRFQVYIDGKKCGDYSDTQMKRMFKVKFKSIF